MVQKSFFFQFASWKRNHNKYLSKNPCLRNSRVWLFFFKSFQVHMYLVIRVLIFCWKSQKLALTYVEQKCPKFHRIIVCNLLNCVCRWNKNWFSGWDCWFWITVSGTNVLFVIQQDLSATQLNIVHITKVKTVCC